MRLLIDVSGLAYRAAFAFNLTDRQGQKTSIVFGVLKSLEMLVRELEPTELVVCWDGGSDARREIYPEYKANRSRDEEFVVDFTRQLCVLKDVLDLLPVVQVHRRGVEADDVIAAVCEFTHLEDVGIVTGDRDLYQLATSRHNIFDYEGNSVELEFKPSQYVTYKVLVGDPSDNIKGVLGLGDKRVRRLISEHKTLKTIMQQAKEGGVQLGRMSYEQALPIVKRNLQLMKLKGFLQGADRSDVLNQYKTRRLSTTLIPDALHDKLMELGFVSFVRRFSAFVAPFKRIARAEERDDPIHKANAESEGARVRRVRRVREQRDEARAARDAGEGGLRGAAPALRRGDGEARVRRVRRTVEALSAPVVDYRVLRERRQRALRILWAFKQEEGWGWLRSRSKEELHRLGMLINKFELNKDYNPWPKELRWLKELHWEFTTELPEWLKTEAER